VGLAFLDFVSLSCLLRSPQAGFDQIKIFNCATTRGTMLPRDVYHLGCCIILAADYIL